MSEYYFVRGSDNLYCPAFTANAAFSYWFVEFKDSKAKILFNDWSVGIHVLSSESNGMKDIQTVDSRGAMHSEIGYKTYIFNGNEYKLSECFIEKYNGKKSKKKKVSCSQM